MANEGVTRREAGLMVARLALGAAGLAVVGSQAKANKTQRLILDGYVADVRRVSSQKLCYVLGFSPLVRTYPEKRYLAYQCNEGHRKTNDPRLVTCSVCLYWAMFARLPSPVKAKLHADGLVVHVGPHHLDIDFVGQAVRDEFVKAFPEYDMMSDEEYCETSPLYAAIRGRNLSRLT